MNYLKIELTRVASIILDRANVQKGESLLIISETASDREVVDAVFGVAYDMDVIPALVVIPTRGVQMVEPPDILAAAMKAADIAITLIPFESLDCYTKTYYAKCLNANSASGLPMRISCPIIFYSND